MEEELEKTDWQIVNSWLGTLYPELRDTSNYKTMISYVDPDKLTGFYERRQQVLDEFLEISGQVGAEKEFLHQMERKVEKPFHYEWVEGWSTLLFGYTLLGYVSDRKNWSALPYLGTFDQLDGYLSRTKPDEVIAGLGAEDYERMPLVIQACEHTGTKLSLIPFYAKYMPPHPQFDSLNGLPLINLRRIPLDNLGNAFMKRAMDIAGALVLIVLSSPVMLFAAIGVKFSSPGPVIFRQKRVGLNKKPFYMYKFRSMRVNASSDTGWSTNSDPRKTRFGSFIRKFSIDELPQFFNVLKGDMSLVGPRPELPHFVDQFKEEIPLYMVKHQVRPGITGWAQVNGLRGDTSIKERIEHDVYYIENWSILLDIKILFLTLFKGFVNQEKLN